MKKVLVLLVSFLSITAVSFGQKIAADSIFSKYFEATGGKALWQNVKTYTSDNSYSAPGATPYTETVSVSIPDKSIFKSVTILKRNITYTVKGNEGWIKVPIGTKIDTKDLSQAEQAKLRNDIYNELAPILEYGGRNLIVTTVGPETLNGVATQQVELQGKDILYNLWFDAKTGLLIRSKTTAAGIVTTTNYSDYKKSAYGILYPSKKSRLASDDKKTVAISSTLTINPPVSVELFKR